MRFKFVDSTSVSRCGESGSNRRREEDSRYIQQNHQMLVIGAGNSRLSEEMCTFSSSVKLPSAERRTPRNLPENVEWPGARRYHFSQRIAASGFRPELMSQAGGRGKQEQEVRRGLPQHLQHRYLPHGHQGDAGEVPDVQVTMY